MRVAFLQRFSLCFSLILLSGAWLLPHIAHGQAGSAPLRVFKDNEVIASVASSQNNTESTVLLNPEGILRMPSSARFLLWAELELGQLNVLEKSGSNQFLLRKRIPISIGKQGVGKEKEGDQKTPLGIYRLTSFIQDSQLDDFYGLGAFPLNYPNAADALLKRTGYGIWLHGLPKGVEQRPLMDSDGCIVVDNASLTELISLIVTGETYIVSSANAMGWVSAEAQNLRGKELMRELYAWMAAWEARDNELYLDFYASDFSDLYRNKSDWSVYKTRVNNSKSSITLELSDISMLADPRETNLVTVRFYQVYKSNNYNWSGWKEQIWRQSELGWKILYEGNG